MKKLKQISYLLLTFTIDAVLAFLITSFLLVIIFGMNLRYFHFEISSIKLGFITGSISTFVMHSLTLMRIERTKKKYTSKNKLEIVMGKVVNK